MSDKKIKIRTVREKDLLEGKTFFLIDDCRPYVVVRKTERYSYLVSFEEEESSLLILSDCTFDRGKVTRTLAEAYQGKVNQIEWHLRQAISNKNNEGR